MVDRPDTLGFSGHEEWYNDWVQRKSLEGWSLGDIVYLKIFGMWVKEEERREKRMSGREGKGRLFFFSFFLSFDDAFVCCLLFGCLLFCCVLIAC